MLGAIVALALSQCPGGQCYAPTAQPVPASASAVVHRPWPTTYYRVYNPGYYSIYSPPRRTTVGGYCTSQGCYRR